MSSQPSQPEDRDPQLAALFQAQPPAAADDSQFMRSVNGRVLRLRRQRRYMRLTAGILLAVLMMPLQDVALAVSELMITTLFSIENALAAQLLAPVNTVGALLSAVLLALRAVHRRLFR